MILSTALLTTITASAILLLIATSSYVCAQGPSATHSYPFPQTTIAWGFGGSAYQIEGAWNVSGKGLGIYDVWNHKNLSRPNADTTTDHYHHLESDLAYLKQLGSTAYRFSVSWSRILPNCSGAVNQDGIDFYNRMIDIIIANGAEPYLTMFHWDLPNACEDYGSFLNPKIQDDFVNYAAVLYTYFGDRIRYWLTLNEPENNCKFGWVQGKFAPGIKGDNDNYYNCLKNSHMMHAKAVQYARKNYPTSGWKFGMPAVITAWFPITQSAADFTTAHDAGMFWDPSVFGDYSAEFLYTMADIYKTKYGFTPEESALLVRTSDFIGMNYYSSEAIGVDETGKTISGHLEGSVFSPPWQTCYAPGIRRLANQLYQRYQMEIHITECGTAVPGEAHFTKDQVISDPAGIRQTFFSSHISHLYDAIIIDNIPIKAFLSWALLDNYEWDNYEQRWGNIAVDFTNGTLQRYVKNTTYWMASAFSTAVSPFPQRVALRNTPSPTKTLSNSQDVPTSPVQQTSSSVLISSRSNQSAPQFGKVRLFFTFVSASVAVWVATIIQ